MLVLETLINTSHSGEAATCRSPKNPPKKQRSSTPKPRQPVFEMGAACVAVPTERRHDRVKAVKIPHRWAEVYRNRLSNARITDK